MNTSVTIVQNERREDTRYSLQSAKRFAANMCAAAAEQAKNAENFLKSYYQTYSKLTKGTAYQAHHVFQDADMVDMYAGAGYSFAKGMVIALLGGSGSKGSPHDLANFMQGKLVGKDVEYVAYASLRAAGCRSRDATTIVQAVRDYNAAKGWK